MDTTINDLLHRLLDGLAAEGIPDPLSTPFTLATLWLDLCQLAGEEPPVAVATLLDAPVPSSASRRAGRDAPPATEPRR